MTATNASNVGTAFELLIEELANASDIKREGAEAFLDGRYQDAKALLGRMESIEQNHQKTERITRGMAPSLAPRTSSRTGI
jgi:hypothetical protein